jgi:plasmid replication initiation protein
MMSEVETAGRWLGPIDDRSRVTMSNALSRAGHGLTLSEKRLIGLAASKLDSRFVPMAGTVPVARISAMEYADFYGVTMDAAYLQLQETAKRLYDRSITFLEAASKRGGKAAQDTIVSMRWVGAVKYQRGEGWVELQWWPALLPHLMGLKSQFTSYQLKQVSALRSIYSWKLLELLMRFQNTGWAEYTVEDFAIAMDATEKQQSNFNNIRRRIIDPAVKELMEKDGWEITWRPIKRGRTVKLLHFDFQRAGRVALAPPVLPED